MEETDKICEHIFDPIGSRLVKACYETKAKGFQGYCYNTQIKSEELTTIYN